MSKNRVLYVFIGVAILAVATVSLPQVTITKAAGAQASQSSMEGLSALSAHADALNDETPADRSYDPIETERGSQVGPTGLDSSGNIGTALPSYSSAWWDKALEEQLIPNHHCHRLCS